MAEMKDLAPEEQTEKIVYGGETGGETGGAPNTEQPKKPKLTKKRKRLIRRLIVLAVLIALVVGGWRFLHRDSGSSTEVVTDEVRYGSITSTVSDSGLTKARSSETITLTTAGTVVDVLVSEGDQVTAGTPLFNIDSPAAQSAVEKARKDVEGYEKQLSAAQKDIAGLNLAPSYSGKLLDTVTLNPGDTISKGQRVATLADDTRLRLTQYYSYAYAGELKAGQSVDVSVPALMSTVSGTVESVNMVSRITPEGSKLFSAVVVVNNPGSLTAEMTASATVNVGGETVYPYEAGTLSYYRTGDLCSTVSGTVISSSLVDYLQVSAGQVLVRIDGEDSESEIFSIQQSLDTARETLETAEKNLANCSAVAPIDGMVIGLTIQPGDEVQANTSVVTISDTSTILVTANVDERHISYIKPGMPVDLNQWDNIAFGTVETVSLSSTVNNGVATYPVTISVDNSEGTIQVNSYIQFTITASENDNCLILPLQCVRTVSTEDGSTATVVYVAGDRPDNALDGVTASETIPEGYWPVPVEIGISDNYNVEIKSGVEEGTVVFTQTQSLYSWG
jgi:multidrug resistance efflux pump